MHVKKDDTVLVLSGPYAGKKGKVLKVDPEKSKVTVDGVNLVKRHTKPRPPAVAGGIVEKAMPIHSSNVMLVCPKCNKPSRTGNKRVVEGDNKKVYRVCKKCKTDF